MRAPDLEALTGLRSGKRSYYRAYVRSDQRMQQTVRSLDTISRALVRTVEGPRSLLEEVVRAAAEHLHADWALLGLADGVLLDARPRFVAVDAEGRSHDGEDALPAGLRRELGAVRAGLSRRSAGEGGWVRAPMTLAGRQVGCLVATHGLAGVPEAGDLSVLSVLANQAAVSLHTSQQYQAGLALHRRAQLLHDEATAQAADLAARTAQLHQTEQRLLAAHQRELLDVERHRIARELHDTVSQLVLSAGMTLELVRSDLDPTAKGHHELAEQLGHAKRLTQEAVAQLRGAIYALHHDSAGEDPTELPELLRKMVSHHERHLQAQLRVEGGQVPLGAGPEHELARIVGEALFNVAMHAQATRATVRLRYRHDALFMSVADDGCGDPKTLSRLLRVSRSAAGDGRHRGLVNMAVRAETLGGTLVFRRARLGGVRIEVRVPLPVPETGPGADRP